MKRVLILLAVLAGCGVDGEPQAPEGAIEPVVVQGSGLIDG